MAGVCMLDISAAFDVMDHGILLNKLELYGLMKMLSTGWVTTSQGGHKLLIVMDPFPPSYQLMCPSRIHLGAFVLCPLYQ